MKDGIPPLWVGRIEDEPADLDLEFWQTQSIEAKFEAAHQLVLIAHELKGGKLSGLQLCRSDFAIQSI